MRYLQVKETFITDSISFAHGDYVQFIGEVPIDIMNHCYQLIDGEIVLNETKHNEFLAKLAALEAEIEE